MAGLVGFVVLGVLAGLLARLLVPGGDGLGPPATVLLGLVGSVVGGTLGSLLFSGAGRGLFDLTTAGLLGSVAGASLVLLGHHTVAGRRAVGP